MQLPYTIEVHHDTSVDPSGWVARVVELPGCITQADTLEELGEMIKEAMKKKNELKNMNASFTHGTIFENDLEKALKMTEWYNHIDSV